jgi:hypothetical protein
LDVTNGPRLIKIGLKIEEIILIRTNNNVYNLHPSPLSLYPQHGSPTKSFPCRILSHRPRHRQINPDGTMSSWVDLDLPPPVTQVSAPTFKASHAAKSTLYWGLAQCTSATVSPSSSPNELGARRLRWHYEPTQGIIVLCKILKEYHGMMPMSGSFLLLYQTKKSTTNNQTTTIIATTDGHHTA